MRASNIQAILLDFDGTLVDSEFLHYDCWSRAVAPYGAKIGWEDYQRRLVGRTDIEAGKILLSEAGHDPTPELLGAVCAHKHQGYRRRFCHELTIESEILEWIARRPAHLQLGLVSSSSTQEVEPLLIQENIRTSFDFIVLGDHVSRHKPHPEPYQRAIGYLNQGGLSDPPSATIVFEDSDSGVASAQAAGLRVRRVRSPKELLPAIREELSRCPKANSHSERGLRYSSNGQARRVGRG